MTDTGEGRDGFDDVGTGVDLENVRVERAGALFGDDDRGFGFVLGARGATSRSPGSCAGRMILDAGEVFFVVGEIRVAAVAVGGGHGGGVQVAVAVHRRSASSQG